MTSTKMIAKRESVGVCPCVLKISVLRKPPKTNVHIFCPSVKNIFCPSVKNIICPSAAEPRSRGSFPNLRRPETASVVVDAANKTCLHNSSLFLQGLKVAKYDPSFTSEDPVMIRVPGPVFLRVNLRTRGTPCSFWPSSVPLLSFMKVLHGDGVLATIRCVCSLFHRR